MKERFLNRIGVLWTLGKWSTGPAAGIDCISEDTTFTHDFTGALLGDDWR